MRDDARRAARAAVARAAPTRTGASGHAAASAARSAGSSMSALLKRPRSGTSAAPTSSSTARTAADAPVAVRPAASITCSSRSASPTSSSVAAERRDERVRQPVDEPDRVRHEHLAPIGQPHLAHQRIERHEQRVRRSAPAPRQQVEQRRLAGVGVADQRDRRDVGLLPALAQPGPPLPHVLDAGRDARDALPDPPPVGLELRLAGPARADAAAESRQRDAGADQPRAAGTSAARARPATCPSRVRARRAKMSRMSCVRSMTRSATPSSIAAAAPASTRGRRPPGRCAARRRPPPVRAACRARGTSPGPAARAPGSSAATTPAARGLRRARRVRSSDCSASRLRPLPGARPTSAARSWEFRVSAPAE